MSLVATESQYKILERINPLQTTLIEQSIVSSRVALLLRSAEIKLLFSRFVFQNISCAAYSEGNCSFDCELCPFLFWSLVFFALVSALLGWVLDLTSRGAGT